jgi:hypothetical protein
MPNVKNIYGIIPDDEHEPVLPIQELSNLYVELCTFGSARTPVGKGREGISSLN